MARNYGRGAPRGSRGSGRGKGAGFAQSGGKSTTFQGGKGGGIWASGAGGSNGQGVRATGKNAAGNTIKVRNLGGDNTITGSAGAKPQPLDIRKFAGGNSGNVTKNVKPTVRKGAARQRGGSTQ